MSGLSGLLNHWRERKRSAALDVLALVLLAIRAFLICYTLVTALRHHRSLAAQDSAWSGQRQLSTESFHRGKARVMEIIDRIGIDIGIKMSVEDGVRWAATHGVRYLDVRLDTGPEAFAAFTPARCEAIRAQAEAAGVTLGLHSLSAVNIAEYSPYMAEAADRYLYGYIDLAKALQAGWVDVHAGYHFSSDVAQRQRAGLERLQRAVDYAERQGVLLLLENLNWEPEHAEVHYLAHNVVECQYYFDAIDSP
ncbi:MAG: TIM barrel protein, partial [Candidatus Tectomicrobia bacterium]|nr:TIM barrel protein [Candidatus Tectomicrobia bacterium]